MLKIKVGLISNKFPENTNMIQENLFISNWAWKPRFVMVFQGKLTMLIYIVELIMNRCCIFPHFGAVAEQDLYKLIKYAASPRSFPREYNFEIRLNDIMGL